MMKRLCFPLLTAVCLLLLTSGFSQNSVSGEISGIVTDPSGAVVPRATVTLSNPATGLTQNTVTTASGAYRFALLRPGTYTVSINATGFAKAQRDVVVSVGQVTSTSIQLSLSGATQTVEVMAETPLLHTDNANIATTYTSRDVELIPSPGQDITNYAFTAPGVTLSTGAGYGNFTAFGLPGTSNLYTVNGNDYNDPYLNLNNSGASNMALGANELQELAVVNNGYTGEYGRAAGANVNYTTKSGTNQFHGDAMWYWNGTSLNANDWFANNTVDAAGNWAPTPRPHAVSNQWAGSIGGPIKKDKLFFFYDNEGIRYVLPGGGGEVFVPTSGFETATIAHLTATNASQVPFCNTIFKLYNGAPGIERATPLSSGQDPALGCGDLAGTGTLGVSTPCAQTFQSTVNNLNKESLQTLRIDWNASDRDKWNFRVKRDVGVQATGTDPINAAFNANSNQPEWDGQGNWTRVFSNTSVNQFIASGLWYSALFGPPDIKASLAVFPTTISFTDGGPLNNLGGSNNVYPQ
ncbi:MAG TPA: carboxypeptidase-like regulatory domain-containing protein, partial [Terriglobales bacterium]|nr:carboxypeptidase-like regulatory domain-containing protein [Terriglobales bacterium]